MRLEVRRLLLSIGLLFTLEELLLPSEPILSKCQGKADDRFFADILLTPLEATRIRLVSDRNVGPFRCTYAETGH